MRKRRWRLWQNWWRKVLEKTEKREVLLKGIPIMPGICIGQAQVLNPSIKTPVTRKIQRVSGCHRGKEVP